MNTTTAIAQLEAYIAAAASYGDVSDAEALAALDVLRSATCLSNHQVGAMCARQLGDLQAENARLRAALQAVKIICAGLSMTDANWGRAELARLESYIDGILAAQP